MHPDCLNLVALGIRRNRRRVSAALARRSRRIRLVLRRINSDQQEHGSGPSSFAVDTDTLLSRFDGIPALRAPLELANGLLGHELSLQDPPSLTPCASLGDLHVGASEESTSWLRTSEQAPPGSFTLSDDGESWHIGHHLDRSSKNSSSISANRSPSWRRRRWYVACPASTGTLLASIRRRSSNRPVPSSPLSPGSLVLGRFGSCVGRPARCSK